MNSSLLNQIAWKPSAGLFLFLAVHPCPGVTQTIPKSGETKTVELTQVDLFSLPNWQHERVAVIGFTLGMTRVQASQIAQTHGFRLKTNVAPKTVGELKGPCIQVSCAVYQINGNWIGVDLSFDAGDHITTIKVSLPEDADPEVKRISIARQFKGLTYEFFNRYSDALRNRMLGPAEGKEKPEIPGAAITHVEYDYPQLSLVVHTTIDKRDHPPKPFDLEVDFLEHK